MSKKIIGREREIKKLDQILSSKEAEFLAVYGRRRVGKTFLIREYFSEATIFVEVVGVKDASMQVQLENFSDALSRVLFGEVPVKIPSDWKEAFSMFTKALEKQGNKKIVLFLDELPWLATKKSNCVQMIDYFWNAYWSKCPNLILIACGSAASWMLDHLIHAKGGLYNRLTKRILLEPFSLRETEEFLLNRSVRMSRKQIIELYMAVGGIPYYLKEVKKGQSATQAIDELCFTKSGVLYEEFTNLFRALFDQVDANLKIVSEIVKGGNQLSREKLIEAMGGSSGGRINQRLHELEASGFIRCFIPYGKKKRDRYFRIIDEYTLFYLKWIRPLAVSGTFAGKGAYWQKIVKTPAKLSWAGYAFESICIKHIDQISSALGFSNIATVAGTWRYLPRKGAKDVGTQIDLLFDRSDGLITLCEIKFWDQAFTIDKKYAKNLLMKMEIFEKHFGTNKQIEMAFISTNGIKKNIWSEDLIQHDITLESLFL
ncbi:MAG: ATP-binding protein [Candidatus Algichlamydia australiensis]|nr:ATP-binding protein [Chlamydiales bacterium]